MNENRSSIKRVYWQDVRKNVAKVNPELVAIIDALDPGKEFPLYLAKYLYGDKIVDEGRFFVPTEDGMLVPMESVSPFSELVKDFSYSGGKIPFSLIVENSCELLKNSLNRAQTYGIPHAGSLLAGWRWFSKTDNFHPYRIFNITSGASSCFLIPDIRNTDSLRQLRKKFGYNLNKPKTLLDQFEIFKAISKRSINETPWHSSLLLFTNNWIDRITSNDKKWLELKCYLLNLVYGKTDYWRNKIFYDNAFSTFKENKNLKLNPYVEDIVKHLISLSTGIISGHGVATDNTAGPFSVIQKAIIDIYRLKDYVPTIMHPVHFSPKSVRKFVYCSLNFPTALEFSFKSRDSLANIDLLKEIKLTIEMYIEEVKSGRLKLDGTILYNLADKIIFEFFHTHKDINNEILLTSEMPKLDSSLTGCLTKCKNKTFSASNSFVRGCIRLSIKE